MSEFAPEALPPAEPPAGYPATASYATLQPTVPQDAYDAQPPLSQGERVLDTYIAPSKTFADIRRNRSWWLPYLLLVTLGLIFGGVVRHRVSIETLAENTLRSNPAQYERIQNAPPEQRASTMKMTGTMMQVGLFSGPVFLIVWVALLALLLWVGFNFLLGGSSTYPQMFAVGMYASLPSLLLYLLTIAVLFTGDPESFNLANAVGTNPGYYLSAGTAPALKTALTSLDLFTVWEVFLLGLGGAMVARVKVSSGLLLTFGAWLVIVLVKMGFAVATS